MEQFRVDAEKGRTAHMRPTSTAGRINIT